MLAQGLLPEALRANPKECSRSQGGSGYGGRTQLYIYSLEHEMAPFWLKLSVPKGGLVGWLAVPSVLSRPAWHPPSLPYGWVVQGGCGGPTLLESVYAAYCPTTLHAAVSKTTHRRAKSHGISKKL